MRLQLILLLCVAATACSEAKVEARELLDKTRERIENFEGLSTERLQEIATKSVDTVVTKFGEVKDEVSAKSLKENLEPVLRELVALKQLLGKNLPDMSALKTKLAELKQKYGDDEKIMAALKPLFDRIAQLVE